MVLVFIAVIILMVGIYAGQNKLIEHSDQESLTSH